MNHLLRRAICNFSTITYLRGKPQLVDSSRVKLRGIKINSTKKDSPNLIFFPQIFDKAENWLPFFTNPNNKILDQRNVWIVYPRNFGTSDHTSEFNWQEMSDDVARFMYEHQISMATFGGHGLGGKIALAAASYNLNKATGYFGIASSPMNQYYFEAARQVRRYVESIRNLNLSRGFHSIVGDLKQDIQCPKWRSLIQNNLAKGDASYRWDFNVEAIANNLLSNTPNSLWDWPTTNGLFTGKAMFTFPEYSRWVHLGTNTLPMLKVCPQLHGFNQGISFVQGDENPQNHWVYESDEQVNTYAARIANFVRHYDGVHVLLKNREEVGSTFIPDLNLARVERDDFAGDKQPAHYYHNWRFNNPY